MPQCKFCSKYFSNQEKYENHMKFRQKKCKEYENTTFVCVCDFKTKGLSIIKRHQKYCNVIRNQTPISEIILKKLKRKLNKSIKHAVKINNKLVEPAPIVKPKVDKKQISNLFKARYDLLCSKNFDEYIANIQLICESLITFISNIDSALILNDIEQLLESIINTENIDIDLLSTKFDLIKNARSKLFICLSGNEIQNLVNENYGKLLSFLFNYNKRLNKTNKEKLVNIISMSLTGIEGRLINNLHIKDQGVLFNLGEITDATKNIYFNEIKHTIETKPYSFYSSDFLTRIKNPLISVVQFSKYIETFLLCNHCIIYCEHENVIYSDDDPYSVYLLNKIENGNRYWYMDTRAENLALEIIDSLKMYCLDIFSRLWKFKDYKTFTDDAIYLEIAKTIFLLCDPIKLSNKLRFILKKKKSYVKSDNDFFNMKCDDLAQKQKFENNIIEQESLKVAVSEMFTFEDLQKYNIDDFINTINKI